MRLNGDSYIKTFARLDREEEIEEEIAEHPEVSAPVSMPIAEENENVTEESSSDDENGMEE